MTGSHPRDPGEPIDLDSADAVVADDALVERLRHALSPDAAVVWDDDDEDSEDLSYALLRALQRDVSMDLDAPVPVAEVVPLAERRRGFGRAATVAAVAAGVLSVAGVAAAATSSPGSPLYGVRSAVSSAVHDALDAITPSTSSDAPAPAPAAATPTATISPRGTQISTAARSASAVIQIEERLTVAARLIDNGRGIAAGQVLDQAQRRLLLVSDVAQRSAFQLRIDALRARIAALPSPHGKPTSGPAVDHGRPATHQPQSRPRPAKSTAAEHRSSGGGSTSGQPAEPAAPAKPAGPKAPVLPAPAQSAHSAHNG